MFYRLFFFQNKKRHIVNILIYVVFFQIGFLMQHTMGTSPTESMAAAGNIFLGQVTEKKTAFLDRNLVFCQTNLLHLLQTETVLLIKPYISALTLSEIHALMTGGFASISGSILGAFIALVVRNMKKEEECFNNYSKPVLSQFQNPTL